MSQCDRVTGVALSLCRLYLSCKDAFPTPQMKVEWEEAVWREACTKTGTNPESFIPFELVSPIPPKWRCVSHYFFQFSEGNMKLFTQTKKRVMHIVEVLYEFDTSHAPDSISRNATLSQALLSDMAFIYRVCPSLSPFLSPFTNYRPSRRNLTLMEPITTHTDILHSKRLSTSRGFETRTMTGSFFTNTFLRCQSRPLRSYSRW